MSTAVSLPNAVPVEVKYCRDCRELNGSNVPAERILPGGTRLCDFHWRKRAGMKPLTSAPPQLKVPAVHQEEKEMPARKVIDWDAVQRDRDAGMSVSEICEKYKVSNPTVYTRTHGTSGHKSAGGGQKRPTPKSAKAVARSGGLESLGGSSIAAIIADLRGQRDAMTAAIEALEKLGS